MKLLITLAALLGYFLYKSDNLPLHTTDVGNGKAAIAYLQRLKHIKPNSYLERNFVSLGNDT